MVDARGDVNLQPGNHGKLAGLTRFDHEKRGFKNDGQDAEEIVLSWPNSAEFS